MNYWLIKTEPQTFSWSDLLNSPQQITSWEGVRNYQARNFLRQMKAEDHCFFYHSSCAEPGIVGIVKVVREAYPDETAFDKSSPYFDIKSQKSTPQWFTVDVQSVHPVAFISLTVMKNQSDKLKPFALLQKGNRLSVMPLTMEQWNAILDLEPSPSSDK